MKQTYFLMSLLGLAAAVMLTACRAQDREPQNDARVPVRMAAVEHTETAKPLHTYGRLASKKEMKLSFKINGIIRRIMVDEGQAVRKGQVLARLDLAEIESQVEQARSAFTKAERDLERVENLYREKAATLEQYQNVQTAHQVAQSQLDAAEFNLLHSEIRAPDRGRILKRLMEENEMVGAGMPVFFFASTEEDWVVRVGLSDSDLVRIQPDDPALVTFDAYPGEKFSAVVSQIVEAADPLTGTYEVELVVDSEGRRLVSGFVAEVDILPSSKRPYAIIPVDALVTADGQQGFVYTVDRATETARRLSVKIGFLFQDKVAVESGLEDISQVVADGAPYLSEGAKVTIVPETPTTERKTR